MQVRLVVTNKTLNESTNCDLAIEGKITFGRYLGSPVTLQGDRLSRNHFSLMVMDGALLVEDLSSNGTWLNGVQLKEKISASVKSGDVIEIPGYQMEVNIQTVSAPPKIQTEAGDSPEVAPKAPVPAWKRSVGAVLHVLEPRETVLLFLALISFTLIAFFLNS
jgi:hypothetical protein